MSFEIIPRQSLIVWLYTLKHLKSIRKHGHIHYISKKLKYVVLYVNADQIDQTKEQLERYHFVRKVDNTFRDDIDMTFKDSIPNRIDPNLKNSVEEEQDYSAFISNVAASLDLPSKNKQNTETTQVSEVTTLPKKTTRQEVESETKKTTNPRKKTRRYRKNTRNKEKQGNKSNENA